MDPSLRRSDNFEDRGPGTPESVFGPDWQERNPMDFLRPHRVAPRGFTPFDFNPFWDPHNLRYPNVAPFPEFNPSPGFTPQDPFLPQPRRQVLPGGRQ